MGRNPAFAPRDAEPSTPAALTKACPLCGLRYEESMRFCAEDGAPLVAVVPTAGAIEPVEPSAPPPPLAAEPEPEPVANPEPLAEATVLPEATEPEDAPTLLDEGVPAAGGTSTEDQGLPSPPEAPPAEVEAAAAASPPPIPEPSEAVSGGSETSAASIRQFCDNCGAKLEPDAAFCSDCGTTVDQEPAETGGAAFVATAMQAPINTVPDRPEAAANEAQESDGDEDDLPEHAIEEGRGSRRWLWIVATLALLGGGAGAAYYYRDVLPISQVLATEETENKTEAEVTEKKAPLIPKVAGIYSAFLMDQEIEIEFEGEPAYLAESRGTARYLNTINGGRCVSRLVAIQSGGIGGEPSGKVLFSQQPKDGEPACAADIPMLINIADRKMTDEGVVSKLSIEWKSPETEEVLMNGELELTK
jgi:hypothetical protein